MKVFMRVDEAIDVYENRSKWKAVISTNADEKSIAYFFLLTSNLLSLEVL